MLCDANLLSLEIVYPGSEEPVHPVGIRLVLDSHMHVPYPFPTNLQRRATWNSLSKA